MTKLPVFKAVGATYAFVFGNFFECIKIIWLPLAILYGFGAWIVIHLLPVIVQLLQTLPTHPEATIQPQVLRLLFPQLAHWYGLLLLTALIFAPMLFAGILRFVLRGERPRLPFYLGFGGDELRLIGTALLAIVLLMLASLVATIAIGLLVFAASFASEGSAALAATLGAIAMCVFLYWLMLRLSLAGAGAVAERSIGVGPSWSVTKGNVWRLLAFWILVMLPIMGAGIIVGMVVIGVVAPDLIRVLPVPMNHHLSPQEAADLIQKVYGIVQEKLPILIGISFAVRLIATPILISAAGVAYRLITEGDEEMKTAERT